MISLCAPTIADPYAFEGPYADCFEGTSAASAMDKRHIFMLHEVLRVGGFRSTLEIGCYNGASSTAFIEALNGNFIECATFCEVSVRPSLIKVLKGCNRPLSARLTTQPSWAVLDTVEHYDFIFVDGGHDLDTVSVELKKLQRRRPLCVMGHDTAATVNGYGYCEGALLLADWFRGDPDYFTIEDNEKRTNERTERGLFFATTDSELHAKAQAAFNKYR